MKHPLTFSTPCTALGPCVLIMEDQGEQYPEIVGRIYRADEIFYFKRNGLTPWKHGQKAQISDHINEIRAEMANRSMDFNKLCEAYTEAARQAELARMETKH